jgi:hypothetical protein
MRKAFPTSESDAPIFGKLFMNKSLPSLHPLT